MAYNVSAVRIEGGVITADFYGKASSQKAFLADKTVVKTVKVAGWKFSKIHITHGDEENGAGWAFH